MMISNLQHLIRNPHIRFPARQFKNTISGISNSTQQRKCKQLFNIALMLRGGAKITDQEINELYKILTEEKGIMLNPKKNSTKWRGITKNVMQKVFPGCKLSRNEMAQICLAESRANSIISKHSGATKRKKVVVVLDDDDEVFGDDLSAAVGIDGSSKNGKATKKKKEVVVLNDDDEVFGDDLSVAVGIGGSSKNGKATKKKKEVVVLDDDDEEVNVLSVGDDPSVAVDINTVLLRSAIEENSNNILKRGVSVDQHESELKLPVKLDKSLMQHVQPKTVLKVPYINPIRVDHLYHILDMPTGAMDDGYLSTQVVDNLLHFIETKISPPNDRIFDVGQGYLFATESTQKLQKIFKKISLEHFENGTRVYIPGIIRDHFFFVKVLYTKGEFKIQLFDSLFKSQTITQKIKNVFETKYKKKVTVQQGTQSNNQDNGRDCGVFLIWNIYFDVLKQHELGKKFVTAINMSRFWRPMTMYCLFNNKLFEDTLTLIRKRAINIS